MNEIRDYFPKNFQFPPQYAIPAAVATIVLIITAVALRYFRSSSSAPKPKPITVDIPPPPPKKAPEPQISTSSSDSDDTELEAEEEFVPPPKKQPTLDKRKSVRIVLPQGMKGAAAEQEKVDRLNARMDSLRKEAPTKGINPEEITLGLLTKIEKREMKNPSQITLSDVQRWLNKAAAPTDTSLTAGMGKRRQAIQDEDQGPRLHRGVDHTVVSTRGRAKGNKATAASLFPSASRNPPPNRMPPPPPPPAPAPAASSERRAAFTPDAVKDAKLKHRDQPAAPKPAAAPISQHADDMLSRVHVQEPGNDVEGTDDSEWDD